MCMTSRLQVLLLAAALSTGTAAGRTALADSLASTLQNHSLVTADDDDVVCVELDSVMSGFTAAEIFKTMPDSLLPYLTRNNRLDMIDFIDSGMKAEVTNALDGKSEMTSLAPDSLTIRLSEASALVMFLFQVEGEPVDGCRQIVCLVNTLGSHPDEVESTLSFYSARWNLLENLPKLSEADNRRIMYLKKSTIVNCITEKLNK